MESELHMQKGWLPKDMIYLLRAEGRILVSLFRIEHEIFIPIVIHIDGESVFAYKSRFLFRHNKGTR